MATHDYVIDNGTGSAVRTDLNNALAAIVSNNSSSTEPSTKYAYQWWADTNTGILKIRNSSNNGWVELLQLDGTLTLEDGTASSPALAFRDDLDTGIFSDAANALGIATAGVERIEFGTTECVVNDTGVDVDFRVEGDSKTSLLHVDAGNDRVGIGTASPASLLHSSFSYSAPTGGIDSNNALILSNTDINNSVGLSMLSATNSVSFINFGDTDDGDIGGLAYFNTDNSMRFTTNGNERLRIDSSGQMGLGTTSLSAFLHVEASGAQAFFSKSTTTTAISLTFGATCSHTLRCENGEFAFGLSNADPFPLYIQGRSHTNGSKNIALNPLGGVLYINNTNNPLPGNTQAIINLTVSGADGVNVKHEHSGNCINLWRNNGDGDLVTFYRGDGTTQNKVGSITVTSSATQYNTTSSDRSLKKNFEVWNEDVLSFFKNLNPQKFNFTNEDDGVQKTKGYVAQDLAEHFSEAYPKDKTTDKYMFNPSGMIVYLMKAIQELEAKVASLEAS